MYISSLYGDVDTSPYSISGSNPDWYYGYFEYDDYLESECYDLT